MMTRQMLCSPKLAIRVSRRAVPQIHDSKHLNSFREIFRLASSSDDLVPRLMISSETARQPKTSSRFECHAQVCGSFPEMNLLAATWHFDIKCFRSLQYRIGY